MAKMRSFRSLVNAALEAGFERFYDIEYPAPTRPKDIEDHGRVEKLARDWVGRVMLSTGTRKHAHIRVTEARSDGSIVFHIFLGGCDWEKFEKGRYLQRWYEKTGGAAYKRSLEPARLGGLLHHFVMKLDCRMEVLAGAIDPNMTFRRSDFR
jgi:hypothetical protein